MTQKQRIDFIDLAKGVCMILIVVGHCGINTYGGDTIPLYFIMSGMFFKTYDNSKTFFIKKINGILIPFLFFYLIAYIPFYIIKFYNPNLLITASNGLLDIFNNRQFFNGPIWFVITLFGCNILLYIVFKLINKDAFRIPVIIIIGTIGWMLGYYNIFLPCFVDVAMTSLPFFALGYYLKKTYIFNLNRTLCLIVGIAFLMISCYIPHRISLHYNIIENLNSYFVSLTVAFAILYISASIKYIPFINYFGKFSLIPLCIHHMIYRPLKVFLQDVDLVAINNVYIVAGITMLISTLCIPICIKYIPWFVAQKDLIK